MRISDWSSDVCSSDLVALEPCSTVTVALDLVRSGEVAGAVVPIENSVEGSVPVTLDELATGDPLVIAAEATVPIQFSLIALPGTTLEAITVVGTPPHAAAQPRTWVAPNLPQARVVHTTPPAPADRQRVAEGTGW